MNGVDKSGIRPLWGGIEAGGTKFICAIGAGPTDIIEKVVFQTTNPEETLDEVCAFFRDQLEKRGSLKAVGIGAFGPIDINPMSENYGRILSTPKTVWRNADILGRVKTALKCPVAIDTDVNCALIGEVRFGAGRGIRNLAYITIGTGVGAGLLVDGKIVYGESHPEMGHIFLPKLPEDKNFSGSCPYHHDQCIEGLAAGPAIMARWGAPAAQLPPDHAGWEMIAHYISLLCLNILLSVSPQRIILGGGVMKQAHLYPLIRDALHKNLNGYYGARTDIVDFENFIVPPQLTGDAGIAGAITLAQQETASIEGK